MREVRLLKPSWMVALVMIALVPTAADGRPVLFQDDSTGLTVDLAAGVPSACVLKPATLRDPSTCEGVDLSMAEQGMGDASASSLLGQDRTIALVVGTLPAAEGLLWTKDAARQVSSEFLSSFSDHDAPPVHPHPDFRIVDGRQVLWDAFDMTAQGRRMHWVMVTIVGPRLTYELQLTGPPDRAVEIDAIGEAVLASAKTPAPTRAAWWPENQAMLIGYQLARALGGVAPPVIILVFVLVRRRRQVTQPRGC